MSSAAEQAAPGTSRRRVAVKLPKMADEVIVALERLEKALQDNVVLARKSTRRAERIRRLRRRGLGYRTSSETRSGHSSSR